MRPRKLAPLALVGLAPLLLLFVPQLGGGDVTYPVLSGSMQPTFAPGDFIVSEAFRAGDPLVPGDVITYRQGKVLVTHRVIGVEGEPGARLVRTQGDANAQPDPQPIHEARIVAKFLFDVPAYGHLAILAARPEGRVLLIMLPAAAVLVLEVRRVARLVRARPPAAAAAAPARTEPKTAASAPRAPGAPVGFVRVRREGP